MGSMKSNTLLGTVEVQIGDRSFHLHLGHLEAAEYCEPVTGRSIFDLKGGTRETAALFYAAAKGGGDTSLASHEDVYALMDTDALAVMNATTEAYQSFLDRVVTKAQKVRPKKEIEGSIPEPSIPEPDPA